MAVEDAGTGYTKLGAGVLATVVNITYVLLSGLLVKSGNSIPSSSTTSYLIESSSRQEIPQIIHLSANRTTTSNLINSINTEYS